MVLFIDGFAHYGTAQIEEKWTSAGTTGSTWTIAPGEGRSGGSCIKVSRTNVADPSALQYAVLANQAGVWTPTVSGTFGCALKIDDLTRLYSGATEGLGPQQPGMFFRVFSGLTEMFGVWINPNGTFTLRRLTSYINSTIMANSVQGLQSGVWAYVEIQWLLSTDGATADGSVLVRVNGATILNYTGIVWGGQYPFDEPLREWTAISTLGSRANAGEPLIMRMADVYLADRVAPNSTFLGDVTIDYIKPNGAGGNADWANSGAGANWEDVDDASPNDDTDYVEASAADTRDSYAFEDVVGNPIAIQIVASVRKVDESAASVAPITRQTAVDDDGPTRGLGNTDYSFQLWPQDVNPVTEAPWTEAQMNAAQWGIVKVS